MSLKEKERERVKKIAVMTVLEKLMFFKNPRMAASVSPFCADQKWLLLIIIKQDLSPACRQLCVGGKGRGRRTR